MRGDSLNPALAFSNVFKSKYTRRLVMSFRWLSTNPRVTCAHNIAATENRVRQRSGIRPLDARAGFGGGLSRTQVDNRSSSGGRFPEAFQPSKTSRVSG